MEPLAVRSPSVLSPDRLVVGMDDRRAAHEGSSRRSVLLRGGVAIAGTLPLAGCTEDVGEDLPANEHWPGAELVPDLPVRERSEVLEAGIEELSDAEVADVEDFVAVLEARDLGVESAEIVVEQLHLEYVETAPERRGTLDLTAAVAGAFAALVAGGFEGRGLELVVLDADGSTIGVVEIATEWAAEYNGGGLTAAEYGELVAGTIETRRAPPDPDVAPDE